jgi:hypothetical protein
MKLTIYAKTMKVCLPGAVLLWLIAGTVTVNHLHASPLFSTTASGTAREFEITCSTCPNPVTVLSSQSDGGFGDTNALVEFLRANAASYSAIALITGPNSLPHLGASATADIGIVPVPPSTFFHDASAVARATQMYTYTGNTATDYTLAYNIDGSMFGGLLTEIAGGFTVFGKGFNPGQEIQPVLGFTFDHASGDGTVKPVHLSGDVTFTLNPGDVIFVQATLEAITDSRSQQLPASADASHTLDMLFTQGDTSLLIPAATDVGSSAPEPGTTVLISIGGALLFASRHRRSRT